jgi:hypothetical protein
MKSSLKNALNSLALLVFMALAWATSKKIPLEPIKMEVKINTDSTAFILKNLENIDFQNGKIRLKSDSAGQFVIHILDNFNIKANAVDTLSFNRFLHELNKNPFSKKNKLKSFSYLADRGKSDGFFSFDF